MKYKVTVEQLVQNEDSKYPDKETIFEQTIDGEFLDLQAIIQATNSIFNQMGPSTNGYKVEKE